MLNSLSVFLAFFAFLAFGYLSLVRMMSKRCFSGAKTKDFFSNIGGANLLRNLGSSAFFVSLPATSLLLFWGWGPALLWLLVFHLIVESMCHMQYSAQQSDATIADYLLRSERPFFAALEQGFIQAFFLLSMGAVTALLATLVDRQSGLLFAILFLLPARSLLRHPSKALPLAMRILGAFGLLALGLTFSDQLGFSIYGDWAPFGESFDWLRFNNPTVIAAVLVVAIFKLEKDTGFKNDLSTFAGLIIVLLTLAMGFKILWLQPSMDAPLNSAQVAVETLPNFITLSLFIFTGFTALLVRLLIEEENLDTKSSTQFGRLQMGSLLHLIFLLVLVLSLACAIGIGAWKTHFTNWNDSLNLLDHLNLTISSTLNLIDSRAETGAIIHNLLLAALCFTGFSFMLMCADQLTLEEREKETIFSLVLQAKVLQAILIFLSSAFFISQGINLNIWLLIGMLGWVLVTHLMLGMTLSMPHSGKRIVFSIVCFILLALGAVQTIAIGIHWTSHQQITYALIVAVLVILTCLLWWRSVLEVVQGFRASSEEPIF